MFQLHAVSSSHDSVENFIQKTIALYDLVDFIHIRERRWTVEAFLTVIEAIKQKDPSIRKLIINDRVDIAHMSGISQVQLPSHSFGPKEINSHFPSMTIGCSVHDIETARKKEAEGADYLLFGHIYETDSKKDLLPRGLNLLQQITEAVSIPVIAIGGITPERMKDVKQAGAKGVAVMSGIFSSDDYVQKAIEYREQINQLERSMYMNIIINGKEKQIPTSVTTIQQLIEYLEITNPVIIVEKNDVILQQEDHETTTIEAEDRIEFIQFVGGG